MRETSKRGASAAGGIFRRGPEVALKEIGGILEKIDRKTKEAPLRHAQQLVEKGTRIEAWRAAPDAWTKILAPLASFCEGRWNSSEGDWGRARWQLGTAAKEGLESLKAKPAAPPAKTEAKPKATKGIAMKKPPLDAKQLKSDKGREALLDTIGAWIVDALDGANDDAARAALAGAISAFSDVVEAAGQERGEFAGHFFMVDAVGLDESNRPVPWQVLRERVGDERLDQLSAMFDEVLPEVE
jgi:hypothetical protein